ncbi:MAG: hypothetical protein R3B60_04090 [Candidatus Paceibacterota bacterium]
MNEILHANIFFFIASIGTVVFMIFISVILYHIIKIIKSIRIIVEKIEAGSEVLADDIAELRMQIMNGGFVSRLLGLFFNFSDFGGTKRSAGRSRSRSRRTKARDVEDDE